MSCNKRLVSLLGALLLLVSGSGAASAAEVADARYAFGEENVYSAETELGDLTADAVRAQTGADAVILTAACFRKDLNAGSYDRARLAEVFSAEETLVAADVSAEQLKALLETGVASYTVDENEYIDYGASASELFPQVSGLRFACDVSAPPGQRVLDLEPENPVWSLVTTQALLQACPETAALAAETLETTLPDLFADAWEEADGLPETETGRMKIIGSNSGLIAHRFPRGVLLGVPLLLIVLLLYGKRRMI